MSRRADVGASVRWAALLRGVSPTNASMPALAAAFERAGLANARTVLVSGNVLFDAPELPEAEIEARCEKAMKRDLGRAFVTIARRVSTLRAMADDDPFARLPVPEGAKRVVSFLRSVPKPSPKLPIERDGAVILARDGCEVFTAYVRSPKGPVFMVLIEKTFGDGVTTRTWDTVLKLAR